MEGEWAKGWGATVLVPGLKVTLISFEVVFSFSVLLPQGSSFPVVSFKEHFGIFRYPGKSQMLKDVPASLKGP